jgi:hypothetical protein
MVNSIESQATNPAASTSAIKNLIDNGIILFRSPKIRRLAR